MDRKLLIAVVDLDLDLELLALVLIHKPLPFAARKIIRDPHSPSRREIKPFAYHFHTVYTTSTTSQSHSDSNQKGPKSNTYDTGAHGSLYYSTPYGLETLRSLNIDAAHSSLGRGLPAR